MMTVKELIEKLETMPQDMPVAVYSQMDEGDDMPTKVEVAHASGYQAKEYYCQGDSIPAVNGLKEWVVIR